MEFSIRPYTHVTSTNDIAKEEMRAAMHKGGAAGLCVVAATQTAGRGQAGHVWQSPYGGLYCSVVIRPALPPSRFAELPALIGKKVIAAIACIDDAAAQQLFIKPPNDIMCETPLGTAKLCGILCEALGEEVCVGIGINVERPLAIPAAFADTAAFAVSTAVGATTAEARDDVAVCAEASCALSDASESASAEKMRAYRARAAGLPLTAGASFIPAYLNDLLANPITPRELLTYLLAQF